LVFTRREIDISGRQITAIISVRNSGRTSACHRVPLNF